MKGGVYRYGKRWCVRYGRDVQRWFRGEQEAERFLTRLRYDDDHGQFDPLDWKARSPYAFGYLAEQYLEEKLAQGLRAPGKVKLHINRAADYFGESNVKNIKRRDIKAWLGSLEVKDKTKANYVSTLANFFKWCVDEEIIGAHQVPTIPKVEYELAYRRIISLEVQSQIVDWIAENEDEKVWLAIDMLRTYVALRPGDFRNVREVDVSLQQAALIIWRPTKSKQGRKVVPLIEEHIRAAADFKQRYPAHPDMPFFRHHKPNRGGVRPDDPWGHEVMYRAWKRACKSLGVEGVDLYGGTRHSSTTALALELGGDEVKKVTQHGSSKAFARYCQAENVATMPATTRLREMQGVTKVLQLKKESNND